MTGFKAMGCNASNGWNKIIRALHVGYISPTPGEILRMRSGGEALVFGGGGAARCGQLVRSHS